MDPRAPTGPSSLAKTGTFGFTLTPASNTGNDIAEFRTTVMEVSTLDTLGATWGVNLSSWRGGVPRNQLGIDSLFCHLIWGGGGTSGGTGSEDALIDYPAAGTTVMVHGTSLKVEIVGTVSPVFVADVLPTLSGWITVGATAQRAMCATLTDAQQLVTGGAGGAVFLVPARARAYRILTRLIDNDSVQITQLSGNATPRTESVDFARVTEADGQGQSFLPQNTSRWIPLAPATQSIVVESTVDTTLRAQWVLELG